MFVEAKALGLEVLRAVLPGTKRGPEVLQSIDGCTRPVHARDKVKKRADPAIGRKITPSVS